MKVLWVMNAPIGKAAKTLYNSESQSGSWIDSCAEAIKKEESNIEIVYVALGLSDRCMQDSTGATIYEVQATLRRGKRTKKSSVAGWKNIVEQVKPDIIHIWGTEYTNFLDVIDAAPDIPAVITIQGVVSAIAKYPYGCLSNREIIKGMPITLLPGLYRYFKRANGLAKQVPFEKELVLRSKGILCDNDWALAHYRADCKDVKMYIQPLPINEVFLNAVWDCENINKNTIFTIAGTAPQKGLHQMVKALAIIKKSFPDVKLEIPGNMSSKKPEWVFELPYIAYLKRLIKKLDLEKNINFCGKLSSDKMAEHMSKCNVFAMPSCIENHSSTLREAMYVGCPCVTSLVGSVHEFAVHNENALLFRYEEHEVLAANITRILSDNSLAEKLGKNAQNTISKRYPQDTVGARQIEVYENILKDVVAE